MKKIFLALTLSLFSLPSFAFATFSVGQGGTGVTTFPQGGFLFGNGTSPIGSTYSPSFNFLNATSTTATSTFSGDVDILGELKVGNDFTVHANSTGSDIRVSGDMRMNQGGGGISFTSGDFLENWSQIGSSRLDTLTIYGTHGSATLDISGLSATGDGNIFVFPNIMGISTISTFGLLEANQTWSGDNIFSKGPSATTTVTFGQVGSTTAHACFNTKNTDGADISFYFVGVSMIVENNVCN